MKRNYIEVCLTTGDGVQHLRLHGWLKRNNFLIKTEQILGKNAEDFGIFIIVISNEQLYKIVEMKGDMFERFEVLDGDERWGAYKKISNRDSINNISNFMFVLAPESEKDINNFINASNETTLNMFKHSSDFKKDYIEGHFMDYPEKLKDLDYLIKFFEEKERYEDCALLVRIKDSIIKKNEK